MTLFCRIRQGAFVCLLLLTIHVNSFVKKGAALPTFESRLWSSKSWSKPTGGGSTFSGVGGGYKGGSGGYKGGGYKGGGKFGGGGRFGKPRMDPSEKLRFSKTIKINPDLATPVDDMPFSAKTMAFMKEKGFTAMTPVQSQSYEPVFSGLDVVARSRTGTGKTLAFGLPIIEKLVSLGLNERRGFDGLPLVLILEPTRELALQVAQELGNLCGTHRMRVQAIFGGVSFQMQERAIRSGVHILVATPGRALDHISRGTIDLSHVKHVILDEGDTMLEMGFQKDVETIIANVKTPGEDARNAASNALLSRDSDDEDSWNVQSTEDEDDDEDDDGDYLGDDFSNENKSKKPKSDVQVLLFSATMPGWICKLTEKHMNEPIFLDAVQEGETRLAATIKHLAIRLPNAADRFEAIASFVEDLILTKGGGGQTIVFTNKKDDADNLVAADCFGQLRTQVVHGDISQHQRQATIKMFKSGQIDVLVATDVAARGLDIAGVDLVVHSSPPMDFDTFVHRSGRTGRAGRNGTSILLFTGSEERKLGDYERLLNFKFERASPPSAQEISQASARYAAKRISQVNPQVLRYFLPHVKSLVKTMMSERKEIATEIDTMLGSDLEGSEDDAVSIVASEEVAKEEAIVSLASLSEEEIENLLARCMAAISNKNSIESKSVMSGQSGITTLKVNAMFKNGTTPNSIRDWQKLFAGVLKRALEIEDITFGRVGLARGQDRLLYALIDIEDSKAHEILHQITLKGLPQGVAISVCEMTPHLVDDNGYGVESRYGGARSYSGGGGSYSRPPYGGSSGRPSYGGDRGGGSGKSWGADRGGGDRPSYDRPRPTYGDRPDRSPAVGGGRTYSRPSY